jgi:hypothetical protein
MLHPFLASFSCAGAWTRLWSPRVFRDIHQEIPIPPSLAPLQFCRQTNRVPTFQFQFQFQAHSCLSSTHTRSSFFPFFYVESCLFTFSLGPCGAPTQIQIQRDPTRHPFSTRASMLDKTSYNLLLDGHRAMQIQRQRQSLFTNDRRQFALAWLLRERFHFDVCFDSRERYLHVFFL